MRTSSLLLLLAAAPFAGNMSPYVLANAGLTMPKVEIDEEGEGKYEEVLGYSFTIGLGFRMPINPKLDFDGSAGFSMVQGGEKFSYENTRSFPGSSYNNYRDGYTSTSSSSSEITLSPKLIDLQGAAIFHASPRLALGAGLVFSIPVGGSYEGTIEYSYTTVCNDPTYAYCYEESESEDDKESGTIDNLMDDADTKVNSFVNLKFQGEYAVNERLSVTAGWMLPLGDYISEEGNTVSWSRAIVGINYSFSMSGGSSTAVRPAPTVDLASATPVQP